MNKPTVFTTPAGEQMAVLPLADYKELVAAHEEAEDVTAFLKTRAALASGEDELLPSAVVKRVLAGENPIRVFREHRGLSVKALAQAAGVSAAYMSQIENGKREGRFSTMAAIAKALDVTLDDLA